MGKKSKKAKEDIEEQEVVEETQQQEEASTQDVEQQIADLKNALLRSKADFENFRKRSQRDIQDARTFAKMSAVGEMVPILDTFKMAMMAANADNADLNTLLAGLNMIQNQFNQVFGNLGVSELNVVGEKFDPNLHEAISEQHSDEVEEGVIISQNRCGYKVGDKLLRAASVVVSKGPEVADEDVIDAEADEAVEE